MADSRITGEHFFGGLVAHEKDPLTPQGAARRIDDLTAQLEFFDAEVGRYRALLEQERIRHATELAERDLRADTRLDDLRRELRRETQALHDSYRAKISERRIESEDQLSRLAAETADELLSQRRRHEEILASERVRRETQVNAAIKQTSEEQHEANARKLQDLANELEQATATIARLEAENEGFVQQAQTAIMGVHHSELAVKNVEKRLIVAEESHRKEIDRIGRQRASSLHQLETERQRSAATLADLLEQSAAMAAEADKARADFAQQLAQARSDAQAADSVAQAKYDALAAAADERASQALIREASLESAIADLRQQLRQ